MWGCASCTFHNDESSMRCSVCSTPRSIQSLPIAVSVKPNSIRQGESVQIAEIAHLRGNNMTLLSPSAPPAEFQFASYSDNVKSSHNVTENIDICFSRALSVAETKQFRGKSYSYSFTVEEYVNVCLKNGWYKDKDAAINSLQYLSDKDFIHSIPYSVRPIVCYDKTVFRVGRRYFARVKSQDNGRIELSCEVCKSSNLVTIMDELDWVCSACTFQNLNKMQAKCRGSEDAKGVLTQGLDLVQTLGKGMLNQGLDLLHNGPSEEVIADTVRTALQKALLQQPIDLKRAQNMTLTKADFLGIDRSMREGSRGDFIQPGILTTYAPLVMKRLRMLFGVSDDSFCESLFNSKLELKNNEGGASGSIFLFSADRHFVIKSVTKAEASILRSILEKWYNHCINNVNTLLPRIYGLFKIAVGTRKQDVYYFIVVNNVFDSPLSIDEIYDLKGSTSNRFVEPLKQKETLQRSGRLPTLKDLNWKYRIYLSRGVANDLCLQIQSDTEFLRSMDIMDYSLLIGVHIAKSGQVPTVSTPGYARRSRFQDCCNGIRCVATGNIYFLNIIDVLQTYNYKKKLERFMKTKVLTTVASYMLKRDIQQDHVEEEVQCSNCGHKEKFRFPKSNNTLGNRCAFMIQCNRCTVQYEHVSQVLQKLDQNISSLEPEAYQKRLLSFIKTKVISVTVEVM